MSLNDEFRDGIDDIYAVAGVLSTYTDGDGSALSLTVIVDHNLQQYGDSAEVQRATAALSVRVSEVALPPRKNETFLINSTTYTVDSVISSDDLEHTVLVV